MTVNTRKPLPFEPALAELQAKGFDPQGPFCYYVRTMLPRTDKVLTDLGEVRSTANISGRTEALSATLQNVDSTGIVTAGGVDFSRSYANKDTDHIADGTGTPLAGGKRGAIALDTNNRLTGTFRNNPVNVAGTPTSSTGMSNDGTTTVVTVSAQTFQFGDGTISYNSSSFDPGSFGTSYAWIVDPTFSGGAPTINFSSAPPNQTSANGSIPLGKITTVNGVAKTGGGYSGGTTSGGAGGRGFVQ